MYNRYIRSDTGTYSRVSQEEARPHAYHASSAPEKPQGEKKQPPPPASGTAPPSHGPHAQPQNHAAGRTADGLSGFLRHLLDQFHLDRVDTGDLLLGLLFFLFREDADEELLVALGLLLIL